MKKPLILFTTVLLMALVGCSDRDLSPEDEIRQYIENGVNAAENRSHRDLADLIDASYRDEKGNNKQKITQLARAYFFRHKNIYLFTKLDDIKFLTDNEAEVTLHVAMAGTEISDINLLSNLRARVYRFELELIKEESWLLKKARWQPANPGNLK